MPSRYSHSVVLASYSSRGIIGLPDDQQRAYSRPYHSSPSTPVYIARSDNRARNDDPYYIRSRPQSPASRTNPTIQRTSPCLLPNQDRKSHRHIPISTNQVIQKSVDNDYAIASEHILARNEAQVIVGPSDEPPSEKGVSGRGFQPRQSTIPQPAQTLPETCRLSSPFDPDAAQLEVVSPLDSPISDAKSRQQSANTSKSVRRTKIRNIEPRNDVQEARPYIRRAGKHARPNSSVADPLLSVQQFIDSLPQVAERKPSAANRHSLPPQIVGGNTHSGFRPPSSKSESHRPATAKKPSRPPLRRGSTSFIDSADDEDEEEDDCRDTARHTEHTSGDGRDPGAQDQVVLDHTKESPAGSANGARRLGQKFNGVQAGTAARKKRHSTMPVDMDDSDGFEALPLQKHSPLLKPERGRSSQSSRPGEPLFTVPDEQLSPILRLSTQSPDSMTRATTASSLEPDFAGFSDESDLNLGGPTKILEMHRRYYRRIDKQLPTSKTPPRHSPSASHSVHRGRGFEEEINPQGLPESPTSRDGGGHGRRAASPGPVSPGLPATSSPTTPGFGVPSVIRMQPQDRPAQTRARSNSPFAAASSGTTPPPVQRRSLLRSPVDLDSPPTRFDSPEPPRSQSQNAVDRGRARSPGEWLRSQTLRTTLGDLTGASFGRVSKVSIGHGGISERQTCLPPNVGRGRLAAPAPMDVTDADDELDDDDEEDAAALPPPDISRHRKPTAGDGDHIWDLNNTYPAVDVGSCGGPDGPRSPSRTAGRPPAGRPGYGAMDRLGHRLREKELAAQLPKAANPKRGVLVRLMRRR